MYSKWDERFTDKNMRAIAGILGRMGCRMMTTAGASKSAATSQGKVPLWKHGYKLYRPLPQHHTINDVADNLNQEHLFNRSKLSVQKDLLAKLNKMIQGVGNAGDISVYASVTALYHAQVQETKDKELLDKVIIPCIDSKSEYIDSASLARALWSLASDPQYAKHPVVDKLLALVPNKDFTPESVSVKCSGLNPGLFQPLSVQVQQGNQYNLLL